MPRKCAAPLASIFHIVAAFAILPADAASGARAADPFELEWRELGDGVHAGIRPNSPRSPVVGSTLIVVGRESVLLFDAAGFALQGERAVEKVRGVTDLPVSHIVISHWHGDHNLGVYKILEAFPDAEIVAHQFTAQALQSPLMDYVEESKTGFADFKPALETMVASGAAPDGTPLSPGLQAYSARILEDFEVIATELQRVQIPTVTMTMTDRLDIDLGGRTVELRHLGHGNTKGDVVLWLPDERILATGDIMVHPTPYGFGSYPESWANVLRRLKSFNAKLIVAGHGEIQTDFAYGDLLIETFDLIARQVSTLANEGKTLEETRAAMDFSTVEDRFTHGDDLLTSRFAVWFKTPIVEAAYNIATGGDNESLDTRDTQ